MSSDQDHALESGRQEAYVDLDCDGVDEHIRVGWQDSAQVSRVVLEVSGETINGATDLPVEGSTELVGFGDLDGDSVGDILLVMVDESTILPTLALVKSSGPFVPPLAAPWSWAQLQFLVDENVSSACLEDARPSLQPGPERRAEIHIRRGSSWSGGCSQFDRLVLAFDGAQGNLRVVQVGGEE